MKRRLVGMTAAATLAMAAPAQAIEAGNISRSPAPNQPVLAAQDDGYRASSTSSGGGGFLGGIFGCSADGSSQGIGAAIGGVAGAFLGNRIAGRGSRTLGTLLGGALGAAAGSAIGCKLQKNDRDKAERAAQQALETGESQSWANDETGAAGRIDVADAAAGTGAVGLADLRFAPGVEPASGYARIADSYTTTANVNLRAAPGTSAPVRAMLPVGQPVWVPAQVRGEPWMLVAENGVAQGYVSAGFLRRTTSVAAADCRVVTQSVSVPGEAEQSETYHACKGSDGQWTMTRV